MKNKNFYLGLDVGTDSVGYAVTDEEYRLLKFHGESAWGVHLFEEASLNTERRAFRTARRRLDRRQQRVQLLQDLFACEIAKKDPRFFIRLQESALFREDTADRYPLFNDPDFTDGDYYRAYPTIHHLIDDLMNSDAPHDVRLVYLACAWLVAHRGHFLSNIDKNNIAEIKDFDSVYAGFLSFFTDNDFDVPWQHADVAALGDLLRKKIGVMQKNKELTALLYKGEKPSKEATDDFPFNRQAIIKLFAGGTCKLKDLFCNDDYDEFGSVSLRMDDDKLAEIMGNIGEDFDLIAAMRSVSDWALLVEVLGSNATVSKAKVEEYEQHKSDLALLKHVIKTYLPEKYNEVFRATDKDNYVAYSYHSETGTADLKKKGIEEFSKYILKLCEKINPLSEDAAAFEDMKARLELRTFMPKQKTTDNRVIPHQLYWYELNVLLKKAEGYLSFLLERDEDGLSVSDKIESIFLFRIPYFVGPLNPNSKNAWLVRKEGKTYPWNFENMVDLDASEQCFIKKMTNRCTYLPDKTVLPKDSLAYHKFTVLNEINNLRINGERISIALKQRIYNELFMNVKKVTRKRLTDYLICNGELEKGKEDILSGIDTEIKSNLVPQIAFRRLLESGMITEADAERIIERDAYAEDKSRFAKWLAANYPQITEVDRKYLCGLKISDFGRLSKAFLCEFEGVQKETGEVFTIIGALWNTQYNLMELLSERFTFVENLEAYKKAYYAGHPQTLDDRLDEMYISNAVRRPIYRALDIVKDVQKAFGVPSKIFIEMARGGTPDQKGQRTVSRKQQILDLYEKCRDEDVRLLKQQLEEMGEYAENRLRGDKLFLYYMQLGKCMYSGATIKLEQLGTKTYDIDHIYPQAFVKDDSIINNKVLVLSEENGKKSDIYPLQDSVRTKMGSFWKYLNEHGMMSDEKYKRLTRAAPFTEEEKYGFINRQLTETSQSTKALALLLKERFPETEIVYCKARLVSEFRQEFDLFKSRTFNDLHHAVDAYLNIVTGNVYHMRFTRKWFDVNSKYSVKTRTLFTRPVICGGQTVWNGEPMLAYVKKTAVKNTAHLTKYAYLKTGGLFDQMPVPAAEGLIPRKKDLPTEKYGGYNKSKVAFFMPVAYTAGKKKEILIMSVEVQYGTRFLSDDVFAEAYAINRLKQIIGKQVDSVSFPMGKRPWKVNTMLSLDGFTVCIAGSGGGGKSLVAQPFTAFSADGYWMYYLKKLEELVKKCSENKSYIFDEAFDKVTAEDNQKLYDLYIEKLQKTVYSKRVNNPVETLIAGKTAFSALDPCTQAVTLLNIHQVFGKMSGGCDFTKIGGKASSAATVNFSSTISNWKKKYSVVRVIDQSASGLWVKRSSNLLELL